MRLLKWNLTYFSHMLVTNYFNVYMYLFSLIYRANMLIRILNGQNMYQAPVFLV